MLATNTSELVPLPKGATLHIGAQGEVTNTSQEVEEDVYLTVVSFVTCSLNRTYVNSSYNVPDNYFRSSPTSNYYYHWSVSTITEEVLIGKRTTKTETIYEYLPYAEGESITVKSTTVTSYSYNYQGGFVEKPLEYTVDLNGYFNSLTDLRAANEDLADFINSENESNKYYVDTTTPTTTQTYTQNFTSTYYYITYHDSTAESTDE